MEGAVQHSFDSTSVSQFCFLACVGDQFEFSLCTVRGQFRSGNCDLSCAGQKMVESIGKKIIQRWSFFPVPWGRLIHPELLWQILKVRSICVLCYPSARQPTRGDVVAYPCGPLSRELKSLNLNKGTPHQLTWNTKPKAYDT
jgi:hypothetical protein